MLISLNPTQYNKIITNKKPILKKNAKKILKHFGDTSISLEADYIYFYFSSYSSIYLINKKNKHKVQFIKIELTAE